MNMPRSALVSILLIASSVCAFAATEADYKAAYAAAEAANKEAAALRNQWTTTAATASAKEAEALAKASSFQATSEKERWKDMEIR